MGVGAGLSMYVVFVQKFTFAISSPDEFLFTSAKKDMYSLLFVCLFVYLFISNFAQKLPNGFA